MKTRTLAACLLLGTSSLITLQCHAQAGLPDDTNGSNDDSSDTRTFDTVVVTAQKREQSVQDVPVSVTAFTPESLENSRIDTGTEIARQTPNMRVSLLGDESQPKFVIRGISTPEFNLNAISPTGIFFDEVYIGASFLGGAQLYDLERVEVLRGPQGTLFGKNTTAGAINFVSKRPTFEPEAEIKAGFGSFGYTEAQGAAELPLVEDTLSVRGAFNFAHSDGYIENVNPNGRDLSNIDRASGRLTIAYKNNDGFDATLRGFVVDNNARAIGPINQGTGAGGVNAFGVNPRMNPFTGAPLGRDQVATDRSGDIEVRGSGAYLTLNKDFGFATLTSITSYVDGRFLNLVDADGSIVDLLHIDFASETEEFSQDLRLSSNGDTRFQWIAGLYHQSDDISINTVYRLFGGPPAFPVLTQSYDQLRQSYAIYADGSYDLTDTLSVYGGVRYTQDKGKLTGFMVDPIIPQQPVVRYDDGEPTGRIGLQFEVASNIMLYGQYARGYRSSAINGGALTNPADLNVAEPEKLDAYEIGLKSELFDNQLIFNASVFQYNFKNQQFLNVVGIGTQQLVNAGRSRVSGLEVETVWRPTETFSLTAGAGLLDSEYEELTLNGADLSGNELIEAPPYTFNLAADYVHDMSGRGELVLHANYSGAGSQYYSPTNAPISEVSSFVDAGARIAWRAPSGNYEVAVYGKNLTDNDKDAGVQIDPSTQTRFATVPYPRRYGIELIARF
ncbi:TonB-dependent receptor [Hyphomonas sp.]|uniref:TonB-dependent receptor n=1 Tax=Hyphomonas sp. TaxID=87 RepID=UPI003F6E8D02